MSHELAMERNHSSKKSMQHKVKELIEIKPTVFCMVIRPSLTCNSNSSIKNKKGFHYLFSSIAPAQPGRVAVVRAGDGAQLLLRGLSFSISLLLRSFSLAVNATIVFSSCATKNKSLESLTLIYTTHEITSPQNCF